MGYGDYRQFEPVQVVYKQEFPKDVEIEFNKSIQKIDLSEKTIQFGDFKVEEYDFLISTIPLVNLLHITTLFSHFKEYSSTFFMHRPIYLYQEMASTENGAIRENYITDPNNPIYRENFLNGVHNQESLFKLENAIKIYPGKIYNNNQVAHILEDLSSYGVLCAGRYAEWNSQTHLWNVYAKLKLIKEMIYD
jgi:hypothetical protein